MPKLLTFIVFLLVLPVLSTAQVTYGWSTPSDGSSGEYVEEIITDGEGNIYLIGTFTGDMYVHATSGTDTLFNVNQIVTVGDLYVMKLDQDGNVLWGKSLGVVDFISIQDAKWDAQKEELLIAGNFDGTIDFDPGAGVVNRTATGFYSGFFLRLDNQGNYVDVATFDGKQGNILRAVDVSADGNYYVLGYFTDSTDLDPGVGTYYNTSALSGHHTVLELAPTMDLNWAKTYDNDEVFGADLKLHGDSIFLIASMQDTVNVAFPPAVHLEIAPQYSQSLLVMSYDLNGNLGWTKRLDLIGNSGMSNSSVISPFIAFEVADDAVYVGGSFGGQFQVSPTTTHYSFQRYAAYLMKIDRGGQLAWSHQFAGQSGSDGYAQDNVRALGIGENGSIYLAGSFTGQEDFDPTNVGTHMLNAGWGRLFYVAQWDQLGNFIDADAVTPSSSTTSSQTAYVTDGMMASDGNFIFGGTFLGTLEFNFSAGGDTTTSFSTNGFVVKLTCDTYSQDTLYGTDSLVYQGMTYYASGITLYDTLAAGNGCDSIVMWTTSIDSSASNVGLVEAELGIRLFPNPVSGEVLRITPAQPIYYTIYSMDGRAVQKGSSRGEIPVDGLPAGLYVLRAEDDWGRVYRTTFSRAAEE